ncbi:MAG: 2,3,4,5-tetrahydropyridine-2,6-dicarboxylate N-succinyltransferase [Gemmatimonadaceae bacterium]|nr:2,3,4,5-tetrahydropyridine-2,6-dicarboxylate N-succinyltransferase [Gemmatimonadaceae bacterium]
MTDIHADAASTPDVTALAQRVETLSAAPPGSALPPDARAVVAELLDLLERGAVRAASRDAEGTWRAVPWIKRGILLAFRAGAVVEMSDRGSLLGFFDKDTIPPRRFLPDQGVRVVPGGSSIRRGAHVAPGVVCMPPMFVNVGAWIGQGTMIDSHALVGSCAQIGERVHLSAAAQVGGVLEPVNAAPVIIEDDVVVGGNCGVYEGTVVRRRAVLAAGTILTRGTPVYDLVRERILRASAEAPLEIPEGAVVVAGARAVGGDWGRSQGLSLQTPVIVKYRDERTDLSTALEAWLR